MFSSLSGLLAIIGIIAWIWALVDIAKSNRTMGKKVLWFLISTFIPFGAIVYLVAFRQPKEEDSITIQTPPAQR